MARLTLSEFVLARIAEDEAVVADWDSDGLCQVASMWTGGRPGYTTVASGQPGGPWGADGREVTDARHVRVLYDPARVLAECAAKRAIVEELASWEHGDLCCYDCGETCQGCDCGLDRRRQRTLTQMASPDAEHPDYRPEWAVS